MGAFRYLVLLMAACAVSGALTKRYGRARRHLLEDDSDGPWQYAISQWDPAKYNIMVSQSTIQGDLAKASDGTQIHESLDEGNIDKTYANWDVYVGGAGTLVNNGDGGFDNWRFSACNGGSISRTGDGGKIVDFGDC